MFFREPSTSHHTYTRTQPHVIAGGGRGLSRLSGKEVTDAKQVLVVELEDWKVLGTIVGISRPKKTFDHLFLRVYLLIVPITTHCSFFAPKEGTTS